jgi:hypothetical protein
MLSPPLSLFDPSASGDVTMPLVASKAPNRAAGLLAGAVAFVALDGGFETK